MSGTVHKLPTAATSFYTVRKAGRFWDVVLVTPSEPRPIKTALYRLADRESAIAHAKVVAERTLRPFKEGASK